MTFLNPKQRTKPQQCNNIKNWACVSLLFLFLCSVRLLHHFSIRLRLKGSDINCCGDKTWWWLHTQSPGSLGKEPIGSVCKGEEIFQRWLDESSVSFKWTNTFHLKEPSYWCEGGDISRVPLPCGEPLSTRTLAKASWEKNTLSTEKRVWWCWVPLWKRPRSSIQ